jgi:2-keto-4-pentenoate hydratase/2-oxohepta-3-ene-1,7-dioic acid hydratase in catechol pathway
MKLVRYAHNGTVAYGVLEEGATVRRLAGTPFESLDTTAICHSLAEVRLLAPVEAPRIIGVGLNYVSHIRECNLQAPTIPMLFMKHPSSVVGPGDAIVYPRGAQKVDFEGELAVVLGRRARRVPEEEALAHVLGYTCANDVSERTTQSAEMKMGCLLVGKSYDTFCPLGPVIATGLDPASRDLTTRLNGEVRQRINTSDLLFSVVRLVSYLSQAMTLWPGDTILTGTPGGVGPIQPGDVVEVEISGIGVLRNPIVSESEPALP